MSLAIGFRVRSVALVAPCLIGLLSPSCAFVSPEFLQAAEDESRNILQAIRATMGDEFSQAVELKLPGAERDLAPLFNALPQSPSKKLGPSALRYALHRKVLQRRGWRLKGIDSEGQGWLHGSPTDAFRDVAPYDIRSSFETQLAQDGLSLRNSALMLCVLELFVEQDAFVRVAKAFESKGQDFTRPVSAADVHWALETYLRSAILGPREANWLSPKIIAKLWTFNMTEQYPGWPNTLKWATELEERRVLDGSSSDEAQRGSVSLAQVKNIVREVSDSYGSWQHTECRSLKQMLLSLEDKDCPGRVTLARFYDSALHGGRWQLTESLQYLRASGALDETDKDFPSVIIPNYLTSFTNCVAASRFFATCCLDECESVMGTLEAAIGAPTAPPADIARVVANISTSDQPVRGQLSADLLAHLDHVAKMHDGEVPIHGRLFAQWLHHVFPRECPYPKEVSTTSPKTPLDWRKETGSGPEASKADMHLFTSSHRLGKDSPRPAAHSGAPWSDLVADDSMRQCSSWTETEEMLVPRPRLLLESMNDSSSYLSFGAFGVVLSVLSLVSATKAWRTPAAVETFNI